MKEQLLLVQDVANLGKKGDLVSVKRGYKRNYLLPQKLAVVAGPATLRMRERLIEERKKQAEADLVEAQALSARFEGREFVTEVKADAEGKLYGSVSAVDIVKILEKEGFVVEKSQVVLIHPIKTVGLHSITLRLKEGVVVTIPLQIVSDKATKSES